MIRQLPGGGMSTGIMGRVMGSAELDEVRSELWQAYKDRIWAEARRRGAVMMSAQPAGPGTAVTSGSSTAPCTRCRCDRRSRRRRMRRRSRRCSWRRCSVAETFEQVDRVRVGVDNLTGEPVFETTWTGGWPAESAAEWVAMQIALLGSVARALPAGAVARLLERGEAADIKAVGKPLDAHQRHGVLLELQRLEGVAQRTYPPASRLTMGLRRAWVSQWGDKSRSAGTRLSKGRQAAPGVAGVRPALIRPPSPRRGRS